MTETGDLHFENVGHIVGDLANECALVRDPAAGDRVIAVFATPGPAAPTVNRAVELSAREDGELLLFEPDDDLMLFHRNRREADFLYREVFRDNEYLRNGVMLPERPTVVDVGANVGGASILFGLVRPGARIFALEPVPHLCRAVTLNAKLHDLDVVVIPTAVGDARRTTKITYYPKNTAMSGLLADQGDREVLKTYLAGEEDTAGLDAMVAELLAGESIECEVRTLGQALESYRLDRIDLLKIDVEKAEWQVLLGIDDDLWQRVDQVVMEVHDIDGRVAACVSLLEHKGFKVLVDRNQDLLNTDMYGIYARRAELALDDTAPQWRMPLSSRRALAVALRDALAEQVGDLPVEQFHFVPGLPDDDEGTAALLGTLSTGEVNATGRFPEIEEKLAAIWRDVLKVRDVGRSDDFFDLGGTSLKSVRMLLEVEEIFGENVLSPDQLFVASRFDEIVSIIHRNLG